MQRKSLTTTSFPVEILGPKPAHNMHHLLAQRSLSMAQNSYTHFFPPFLTTIYIPDLHFPISFLSFRNLISTLPLYTETILISPFLLNRT